MARKIKPLIYVFWEGESEQAYTKYLKDKNYKIIKELRKLRKSQIKVRLLMTTACMEYWMLLHYERTAPAIASPADKERIKDRVKRHVPLYEKGDYDTTCEIARNYETAIENGKWTLISLEDDGLPAVGDTDDRNCWLFQGTHTFTTVHEAIEFLMSYDY